MHCAHLGVAVFIIGVTLVNGYETEKDVRMDIGSRVTIGDYAFQFNGVSDVVGPNYMSVRGEIDVLKDGEFVRKLYPEKRTYNASGMVMTEAAIDTGIFRDLYVALGEPLANEAWVVRAYHKPFVDWIWFGCLLMAIGGILSVSDKRYRLKIKDKSKLFVGKKAAEEKPAENETGAPATAGSNPGLVTETRKV